MTGERGAPAVEGRGILLLGFGAERYRDMAKTVARSIRLHTPDVTIAVVTDHPDDLRSEVDVLVPFQAGHGPGFAQKLALDLYSPFDETLFIDSDCLVVRDISFMWDLFSEVGFGVCGRDSGDGSWFGADLARVRATLGIVGTVPRFNGGLMYWTAAEGAEVFASARALAGRYAELGFETMRGYAVTDEPLISLALGLRGQGVVEDAGSTMRTPLGIEGPLEIDVPAGRSRFVKEGHVVSPAVVHFCGDWAGSGAYRRERLKIDVLHRFPFLPRRLVSAGVNVGAHTTRLARRGPAGTRRSRA